MRHAIMTHSTLSLPRIANVTVINSAGQRLANICQHKTGLFRLSISAAFHKNKNILDLIKRIGESKMNKNMRSIILLRKYCTVTPKSSNFFEEMKKNFIATNTFQKTLLTCGSAAIALLNPHRGDMIACLGEVTGESAIKYMKSKMIETQEGADILREKPRINTSTVCFKTLSQMPENTLGRVYADFMKENNITADSRLPVQFIEDPELAYVMQRYREVHDLVHATLFMSTNMLGEVNTKTYENVVFCISCNTFHLYFVYFYLAILLHSRSQ